MPTESLDGVPDDWHTVPMTTTEQNLETLRSYYVAAAEATTTEALDYWLAKAKALEAEMERA